jgi:hypothetical protein
MKKTNSEIERLMDLVKQIEEKFLSGAETTLETLDLIENEVRRRMDKSGPDSLSVSEFFPLIEHINRTRSTTLMMRDYVLQLKGTDKPK